MATKRTVAKKTTSKKSAIKRSASASAVPVRAPETQFDPDANTQAILSGDASNGKPKMHAKSISLTVSVGTYDRDRNIDDFIKDVLERLGRVDYGDEGIHATVTSRYYILDGKVCLPDDYDEKKQTFLPGKVPPSWAGGPKPNAVAGNSTQEQMHRDARELTPDEFNKKYKLGKYRQQSSAKIITPEMQKKMREDFRAQKAAKEDADLEEFDFDEEELGKVADESASQFKKRLKSTKKRVVKKKAETPKKKVIRRKK